VLDLDKASETLQQMEGGSRDEAAGAAPSSDTGASAPAGAASDNSAADDDPMKALQESMKRDAAGGTKP
jgi:hypothetical protein